MDAIKPLLTGNARYMGYGDPTFYNNLAKFLLANPYGAKLRSLDRDMAKQKELYDEAIAKYGSNRVPGHQVAFPGSSMHNKGGAGDIAYANDQARKWAHENAAAHGFHFPVPGENWHVEAIGSRKTAPAAVANAGAPAPGTITPTTFSNTGMTLPPEAGGGGMQPVAQPQIAPEGTNYFAGMGRGLSGGLDGLTAALAKAQQAPPMATQRGGVAGPGGPQYAPLAQQMQFDFTPPSRSKRLSDMLAGLAGQGQG